MNTLMKSISVAIFMGATALSTVALPIVAHAQSNIERAYVYTSLSGEQMADLMDDSGYRTEVSRDNYGDPLIKTQSLRGEESFHVVFYECNDTELCGSVQFSWVGRGISLDTVNAVSSKQRYGKLYIDSDGDTIYRMDVKVAGGVTGQYIKDALEKWESLLPEVLQTIDR